MTLFVSIYAAASLLFCYAVRYFARKSLKINLAKRAEKKPTDMRFAFVLSLCCCCICGISVGILSRSESPVLSPLACGIVIITVSEFIMLIICALQKKGKLLLLLIPVPPAYAAVLVYGIKNDCGMSFLVLSALLTSFIYSYSNMIFNEILKRSGKKTPVSSRLNKNLSLRAVVHCGGSTSLCSHKYLYHGINNCQAQLALYGGNKFCTYGCVGCGSCADACKFNAIVIIDGIAAVSRSKCVGCGACVSACPKNLVTLIPRNAEHWIACSSNLFPNDVNEICKVGCISCGACRNVCPEGAIRITDHLANIDYSKCTSCGKCAEACDRKSIWSLNEKREFRRIL